MSEPVEEQQIPPNVKDPAPPSGEAQVFCKVAGDGWLTISLPLNIPDGDILAYGMLHRASIMVENYFRKLAADPRAGGLVIPR